MPSLNVDLIDVDQINLFCKEKKVQNTELFKLSWALILHCFFDSNAFQVRSVGANIQDGWVDLRDDIGKPTTSVLEYNSEFSKATPVSSVLQSHFLQPHDDLSDLEGIVREVGKEEFDRSTQKVWTSLNFNLARIGTPTVPVEGLLVSEQVC